MKIVIAGGAGFVGTALAKALAEKGHEVVIVDRHPPRGVRGAHQANPVITYIEADLTNGAPMVFGECDAIVNLSGASIFERWTEEYKKIILLSRTKTTENILQVVASATHRPSVFVSASAVGYYGDRKDEALTEAATSGDDFLASVCVEWEKAAAQSEKLGMRWVSVRTAIVLGPGGGMLAKLIPLYKMGIGGRLGSGKQWFSWIHIDDLVAVYIAAITNEHLVGPVNASAPGSLTNKDFTAAMGKAFHRPAIIPVPSWALRIVLGEFAMAVLSSQRVVPKKLEDAQFLFTYPSINDALAAIRS